MTILLRILTLFKPYQARLLIAATCLLATTGLSLAVPWFIQQAIDLGLSDGQSEYLVIAGLSVAGLGVAKGVFSFGHRYLSQWLAQRLAYDLRNTLYDHIQRLSFTYHDHSQIGQLMTRCTTDVNAVLRFASVGHEQHSCLMVWLSVLEWPAGQAPASMPAPQRQNIPH